MTTHTLLIIGRPNVGKSSLFNRLTGQKKAIVHDRRGVTRDLMEAEAEWNGVKFRLIDTAGLEESLETKRTETVDVRARAMIEEALKSTDQVVFVLDAKRGVTNAEYEIADWLRPFNCAIQVVLNKSESRQVAQARFEAFALGFGEPLSISATHNIGLSEMMAAILPRPCTEKHEHDDFQELKQESRPFRLAILGRPNVGKSTITNALLGYQRQVTGDIAGLTRDAIEIPWVPPQEHARGWNLVDTAGLRTHGQYRDSLDRATLRSTWKAIAHADVVALTVEATQPLSRGDLAIARDCATQGRPMILLVNKTDLSDDPKALAEELRHQLTRSLAQVRHLPYLCISALHTSGLDNIRRLAECQATRAAFRVGTGALNRWLEETLARHPLPLIGHRRMRIKYVTQVAVSPPEFALFTSHKAELPEAYIRYLRNSMIETFDYQGIPIRLHQRRGKNPYDQEQGIGTGEKPKHRAHIKRLPRKAQRRVSYRASTKKPLSLKQRAKQKPL